MAQRNNLAAALGAALALDLGTVTPGRAGGWCDDDPANEVPVFNLAPDGLHFLPADVVAVPVGPRPDEALLERWHDGERLTPDEDDRIDRLLAVAPPGWANVLAERTRNALRNRRRARVEHRLGLHCGECSPW